MDATGHAPVFPRLRQGDRVRFVSPASTPERDAVLRCAAHLEDWGLVVDFGPHAFAEHGWFAGTDDQRLADLNDAFRNPDIRAIFATRGGRGSYRIADRMDVEAIRRDPKPLIGFSDITALHMALLAHAGPGGIHGALYGDGSGGLEPDNAAILRRILFDGGDIVYQARPDEPTFRLTTGGTAAGPLIGGNLETLATAAGWALPDLRGAVLLLESVDCMPGLTDRMLTLLVKGGHLAGLAGVAVGQFTLKSPEKAQKIVDLVGEHLHRLGVPVLGGLPFGHGTRAQSVRLGATARLDADAGNLTVDG
ncbi:LD-carboxypeptidase [Rhizobium sp. CSW-27]|uniref:S66 peptidase family protein n=1 Tax=Rhizobium sp. CSW-27 TaxID=2839985 RepID=UPI001C022387|nr:LD-carboxypeptidase [Rhizobium sp. CSW-27]MBT9373133.1 LD-carboxypeptidase [Rhizobium sp. CSW-27]